MKRTALALTLAFALLISLMVVVQYAKSSSKTIVVPDDYPTIQEAIDNADEGSTIFVTKGTYQERVLEINKSIHLLGEDMNETIINLNPPLVNYTLIYLTMQVHSTAITINANDVELSGFTINMPTDGIMSLGGINASGNRIEIVGNKLARECSVQLNGELANFSGNSVIAGVNIIGDNKTITNNLLGGGLDAQGSLGRIIGNVMGEHVNLKNAAFNLILNNSFQRMYMESCNSNFIANNTLGSLVLGFYGHGCFNNTVSNNKITGPDSWGILMEQGSYNVFHDNLISNFTEGPSGYGVAFGGNEYVAENNTFYRNIFVNNECHVGANVEIEETSNIWDNGQEGNYWDDYVGKDINGDGIGDVPYVVEGRKWDDQAGGIVSYVFGQDNHPLMAPFNIDDVNIEFPEWASSHSEASPSPFPLLPLAAVSVAVIAVVAASLVYLKKRKR